jgi:hypothetical protein
LAVAGCAGPAAPSPSGGQSPSGSTAPASEPSGVGTIATASPGPSLPATPANLVTYIQGGSAVSTATYTDSYGTLASFSTPSGNISCGFALTDSWVLCWIGTNSWPSIPKPTCNEGDWGPNWVNASGDGVKRGACLSEQPFPMPGMVLPYGRSISNGSIECRSESAFLACANLSTSNGFAIAKAIYHTYGTVIS